MRHGQTPGNSERRYVGALDQPLSEQGRAEALAAGVLPKVKRVYVTTLKRTHETASICFPNAEQVEVEGLQEMDFGDFAGRSADEMVTTPRTVNGLTAIAWANVQMANREASSRAAFAGRLRSWCAPRARVARSA